MPFLDKIDPVKIFGISFNYIPEAIMDEIRERGNYLGIFSYYMHAGGKIVKRNFLTDRCTFYDSDGRKSFLS